MKKLLEQRKSLTLKLEQESAKLSSLVKSLDAQIDAKCRGFNGKELNEVLAITRLDILIVHKEIEDTFNELDSVDLELREHNKVDDE